MGELLFPDRLRKLRKDNSFTVAEVAEYLSERVKPVSPKTIYGWEKGTSSPSSEIFINLCEMYGVSDVVSTFKQNDEKKDDSPMHFLTPKEWALIKEYRNKPEIKPIVRNIYNLDN